MPLSGKKGVVFVVDDDPIAIKLLVNKLKHHTDITLYGYPTGEECLKETEHKPQVIILDFYLNSVNLDAINGFQLLSDLRIKYPGVIPVLLSGRADLTTDSRSNLLDDALRNNNLNQFNELLEKGAYFYFMKDTRATSLVYNLLIRLYR